MPYKHLRGSQYVSTREGTTGRKPRIRATKKNSRGLYEGVRHCGTLAVRGGSRIRVKFPLANQRPRINSDVDFHNHIAEAAGIRLRLVWRVGRNQKPVTGFHFVRLPAFNGLAAIFAGDDAVFVDEILAVGNFPSDNHFARAAGENVKIVSAGVHFRIVPHAGDLR